jgi:hypothetical protein
VFGNQFYIRRDGRREAVKMLSMLTRQFTTIAGDFDGFLMDIVIDPEIWRPFRDQYQRISALDGMRFRLFHHLAPKIPLFLGGAGADPDYDWIHSVVNVTIVGQLHQAR